MAFDVDAALIVELGERLVARRSVALAELIKNSYDADATEVIVSFKDVTGPTGSIVVVDDGSGMSLKAMRRGWMRIATNDAALNARSARYGRPRTGAKGVGRFACGRLASRLSLESVSKATGGSERVTADFDWHDFEPGRNLSDVPSNITRELVSRDLPTGTTLTLDGLVDTWTQDDISELQTELSDLMRIGEHKGSIRRGPEYSPDPGFDPQILAPEFPKFEGSIGDPFMDSSWGLLSGRVTDQGEPQYELKVTEGDFCLRHDPADRLYQDLSGVVFTIRMMVYQGNRFRSSGYSLSQARQLGRERGGVKIYLDGFQVFSYGSPGDDWLDLDQDRARRIVAIDDPQLSEQATGLGRPMLLLPGNMQLFGAVELSRELNPGLAVSISRERLVQNDTYTQLKGFVRGGIDWMTVCYARERAKARSARQADADEDQTAAKALGSVRGVLERAAAVPDDVRRAVSQALDEVEALLTQEAEAQVSELSMLRVLASAGTTVMVFDHTLRAMAAQLDEIASRLESITRHVPRDDVDEVGRALGDLRLWSGLATGQGSLVGLLVGPDARTRRKSHALRPLVENLNRGFGGYMRRFGIRFENEVPAIVRTPDLYEAEVYAVLINLLTNSFKSVRGCRVRRVRIEAEVTRRNLTLNVFDTGVGMPREIREDVFEAFFTTSQPDPVLGVGTGLGLTIVKDLIRAWGGDIGFVDSSEPWSTAVRLVIPRLE